MEWQVRSHLRVVEDRQLWLKSRIQGRTFQKQRTKKSRIFRYLDCALPSHAKPLNSAPTVISLFSLTTERTALQPFLRSCMKCSRTGIFFLMKVLHSTISVFIFTQQMRTKSTVRLMSPGGKYERFALYRKKIETIYTASVRTHTVKIQSETQQMFPCLKGITAKSKKIMC